MSTTRAEVLRSLRNWGRPVAPATLAHWMNRSPTYIQNSLSALYARHLVDRKPHPKYRHRYLYFPKTINA
jgi:predicted transcriptional regulator